MLSHSLKIIQCFYFGQQERKLFLDKLANTDLLSSARHLGTLISIFCYPLHIKTHKLDANDTAHKDNI